MLERYCATELLWSITAQDSVVEREDEVLKDAAECGIDILVLMPNFQRGDS